MCFSLTAVTGWGLPGKGWTWGDKACGGRDEKEGEVGDGSGKGGKGSRHRLPHCLTHILDLPYI